MIAAALLVVVLVVWELSVRGGAVDALILPSPTQIAESLWLDRSLLGDDPLTTSYEVVLGLAAAVALGATLGVAMHLWAPVRAALRPLVIGSQAVPVPVIAPLEAPSALPPTFTGIKIAAAVAVIGAVFAEWAGSYRGLGHAVLVAGGQPETARAFAATLLLFLLAIAIYGTFSLLERRVVDWTPRNRPGDT